MNRVHDLGHMNLWWCGDFMAYFKRKRNVSISLVRVDVIIRSLGLNSRVCVIDPQTHIHTLEGEDNDRSGGSHSIYHKGEMEKCETAAGGFYERHCVKPL